MQRTSFGAYHMVTGSHDTLYSCVVLVLGDTPVNCADRTGCGTFGVLWPVDTVYSEKVLICSMQYYQAQSGLDAVTIMLPLLTTFLVYNIREKTKKVEVFCELSTP
jgi:hypothetical protein